jgi:hypothetical protein
VSRRRSLPFRLYVDRHGGEEWCYIKTGEMGWKGFLAPLLGCLCERCFREQIEQVGGTTLRLPRWPMVRMFIYKPEETYQEQLELGAPHDSENLGVSRFEGGRLHSPK